MWTTMQNHVMTDNFTCKTGISNRVAYDKVMSSEELQRFQDKFCKAVNLFAVCISPEGKFLTVVKGSESEKLILQKYVTDTVIENLAKRVAPGSLEDTAIEDLELPNMKVAAIAIDVDGLRVMICIVVAMLSDVECPQQMCDEIKEFETLTNTKQFLLSIELLRESMEVIFGNKWNYINAEVENQRQRNTTQVISANLRKSEVIAEIVQTLDSTETIESIMNKVIRCVGEYLNTSLMQIQQYHEVGANMDVIAEWCHEGITSCLKEHREIEKFQFMKSEKPIVLSSDGLENFPEKDQLKKNNITAFVSFPVILHQGKWLYACLMELHTPRKWSVDEVKFISDAVKVLQSILARRIQKNSLASSYAVLEAILDNVGCGIYVWDEENEETLFANLYFKNNFSKEIAEGSVQRILKNGIPMGGQRNSFEISRITNGQWYDLLTKHINWVDGRSAILYSIYDITDKKIYQKKIEQQAYTDFLTGLYNRMCCERDLAWHIEEAKKQNAQGALLYLDLDDFKHINDGLGHQYGDVLLKSISHSLQRINGIENTCYRMGGDEFVIVIPPEHYVKFELIVESIRKIFSKPWYLKDADYYCTMSMGIVCFPYDGESVQDLIKKADIAMYEAKKSGKNRMARYSDKIDSSSNRRLDMEKNMRDATVDGYQEFEIYYQPIIDIQLDGVPCVGAEALIRWNSVELGFISPADFIPLAEYLGLINPIGNHVLMEACRDCKRWNENGYPNYKVNVNLSVVQLLQADIVEIVEKTVKETGINPHNLTLEVTESLAINDMNRMKEILSSIKELGVRIALDDFGTGYSSLNHIREIPFDVIKVDQGFVRDLSDDIYSQSFIKMVAELAGTIGVSICVEGIETKEQYKVLEGMNVRLVQGYYFARPMPRIDFEERYLQQASINKKKKG